jgi:Flp pilus assembly protein TadD
MRVFLDGSELLDERQNRAVHADQTLLELDLGKGKHQLTLVVETPSEEANPGVFVRLLSQNGRVPVFAASLPKGKLKRFRSAQRLLPGLIGQAANLNQSEVGQPGRAAALGSLLLLKEWDHHPVHGSALNLLVAALEESTDEALLDKVIGLTKDANQALGYLRQHLDRVPGSAYAMTQMGQLALDQDRYWEAREWAARAMQAQADYWPARILHNNTLARLGLTGMALATTNELLEDYPGVPWIMMDACDLTWRMGFWETSAPLLDAILNHRRSHPKFWERKLELLQRQSDADGLDEHYRQGLRLAPYSIPQRLAYASHLINNRRFAEASLLLSNALQQTPENPFLLQALGELQWRTGQEGASATLQKALNIRPQNPELEKMLTFASGDVQDFYAPYLIEPSSLADLAVLEQSEVILALNQTVVKVAPNGQASEYHRLEWEITNSSASRELPGFSFSYAPLRQKVELLKAEIYREEETILLNDRGQRRISDPAYRTYYDLVAYQIAFPNLKKGDRIRLEYRIDEKQAQNMFGDAFGEIVPFGDEWPTRLHSYTILFPKSRVLHHHAANMEPAFAREEKEDLVVYSWQMSQVSSSEREARMPSAESIRPHLILSTFSSWDEMGRWYANLIENQLSLDPPTERILDQLVQGSPDRRETLRRIHEYVVTQTRYVALEFGIHGYKPYPVSQVCNRQFGDCKDKASLLMALLRKAGIEASIALVRTYDRGIIHAFPPSLAHFNHAITYVPEFDLYLDGTAEFSGLNELPEMDQGAMTLVVHGDGSSRLATIPFMGGNAQSLSMNLELQADGKARIRGELAFKGSEAPRLRKALSLEARLDQVLQSLLVDQVPGLNLAQVSRSGAGLNEAIALKFEGATTRLLLAQEDGLRLPLRHLSGMLTPQWAANANRRFPLEAGVPRTREVAWQVNWPVGLRVGELPESLVCEDQYFSLTIACLAESQNSLRINYRLEFKTPQIPISAYETFRNQLLAHDAFLDKALILKPAL